MDQAFDLFKDNDDYDSQSLLDKVQPPRNRNQFAFLRNRFGNFIFIQITLITLYTAVFFVLVDLFIDRQRVDRDRVYSPAADIVKFERIRFNATLVIDSPFNGAPSPEVDNAWTHLLQRTESRSEPPFIATREDITDKIDMNIGVSKLDLDKINADSIAVPGTDMFVGGLSVYHELHCLKRIRQYTWKEYYYPNATENDRRLNRLHTDHCIDVLRQAILCHADISLFTLEWSEAMAMPRADFSHEHTCKDWRRIFEWARQRSIPEEDMQALKHPLYGPAFPGGKGSVLGASEDHSAKIHVG